MGRAGVAAGGRAGSGAGPRPGKAKRGAGRPGLPGAFGETESRPGAGRPEDPGAATSPQGTNGRRGSSGRRGARGPPGLEEGRRALAARRGGSAGAKNSPGRGLRSAARALSVLVCLSLGPSLPAPPPALATPLWYGPADGGQWAPPSPPGGVSASPWAQGQGCGWPAPTRELSAPGPPEPGPLFALPPPGPALFTIWAAPKAGRGGARGRNQPPRRPDPRPGLYAGEPGGLGPGTQ